VQQISCRHFYDFGVRVGVIVGVSVGVVVMVTVGVVVFVLSVQPTVKAVRGQRRAARTMVEKIFFT
jgi:hypothetical protein